METEQDRYVHVKHSYQQQCQHFGIIYQTQEKLVNFLTKRQYQKREYFSGSGEFSGRKQKGNLFLLILGDFPSHTLQNEWIHMNFKYFFAYHRERRFFAMAFLFSA